MEFAEGLLPMFRNLIFEPDYPNRDEIIKQSAAFFFKIHNQGIEFIDNTAGNTLIKKVDENKYEFYLVDLNRMNFHDSLSLEQRVKNIAKLTTDSYINKKFSEAYAPLFGVSEMLKPSFCPTAPFPTVVKTDSTICLFGSRTSKTRASNFFINSLVALSSVPIGRSAVKFMNFG